MHNKRLPLLAIVAGSLAACTPASAPTPAPTRPRREAAPPPTARRAPPRRAKRPPARKPPQCLLRSASKAMCLRFVRTGRPRCRGRHCGNPGEYRVVKVDGTVVHRFPARLMGKAVHLSNTGVVLFDLRHAITAPRAIVLSVHGPNKSWVLKASDLLAPCTTPPPVEPSAAPPPGPQRCSRV